MWVSGESLSHKSRMQESSCLASISPESKYPVPQKKKKKKKSRMQEKYRILVD
jgi:hypothetical protein